MAGLTSLPLEMVEGIAEYVDEDDLLALRMTCKHMNNMVTNLHLKSLYHIRRIFLVKTSIKNLAKIATHGSNVRVLVRVLRVSTLAPYLPTSVPFRRHSRSQGLSALLVPPFSIQMANMSLQAATHQKEALCPYTTLNPNTPNDQRLTAFLSLAFNNLPNLEVIEFEDNTRALKRSELNLLYPCLHLGPGTRIPRTLVNVGVLRLNPYPAFSSPAWGLVMTAASRLLPKPNIREIVDMAKKRTPISTSWVRVPSSGVLSFGSMFPNLRALCFTLNMPRAKDKKWKYRFRDWLAGVAGGSLQELTIEGRYTSNDYDSLILYPKAATFPWLRSLSLLSHSVELGDLITLLVKCRRTLKELEFQGCEIVCEPKDGWFKVLRYLIGGDFNLDSLSIVHYYEIVPDNEIIQHWVQPQAVVPAAPVGQIAPAAPATAAATAATAATEPILVASGSLNQLVGSPDLQDYVLPNIQTEGKWLSDESKCTISFPSKAPGKRPTQTTTQGRLRTLIEYYDNPDYFWQEFTRGYWRNGDVIQKQDTGLIGSPQSETGTTVGTGETINVGDVDEVNEADGAGA
ncbi:hypothetical protein TWF281_002907 [Arthrobotrys megalospora]